MPKTPPDFEGKPWVPRQHAQDTLSALCPARLTRSIPAADNDLVGLISHASNMELMDALNPVRDLILVPQSQEFPTIRR